MADKAQVLTEFFKKVEADEKILRNKFPQISGILQIGTVPAAVLQNYMIARDDVQQRMAFSRDLLRQYSDPKTGQRTPEPIPLPAFGVRAPGLTGPTPVAELLKLSPTTLVSGKDVIISAPQVPDQSQLGFPAAVVIIAVIGVTLVVTSVAAKFIIDAASEKQVKLAEQAVELEKQKNFARIWDTAQALIAQCVGTNPTPDLIAKCWDNVAQRFPDIVKAIPDHKLSSGSGIGFFGKVGLVAAGVGVFVVGVWGYRKWRDSKDKTADRAEARQFRRAEHEAKMSRPTAPVRGFGAPPAPAARKRSGARRG